MGSDNKHIIYTAGDIELYLAGKLTPAEMHAMEKAALDDPFLAEAMEGYETMKNTEWNNQLVWLREEIGNKGTVAKVIPLHKTKNNWWKTAAAIFVLGSAAAITYVLTSDNKSEPDIKTVAQTITTATDSLQIPENAAMPSVTASLNPTASATQEDIKANNQQMLAKTESKIIAADEYIPDPNAPQLKAVENINSAGAVSTEKIISPAAPVTINSPAAGNNSVADEENDLAKNRAASNQVNEAEILSKQKKQSNNNYKKEAALNNYFTAQVVAPDNTPLPFTNISIKKENFGTYADAKGMVRLVSTDSILNIEVKSVGYAPRLFTLKNNQGPAKIILQEDEIAQKDKRVIGNADISKNLSSRRAILITDSAVNVEPADGWDNYNTYVANNFEIPDDILKREIRVEVELSFDVRSNGTVTNIRINKSPGAGYDEAAKRLILEGPQWKTKKGKKTSAKVKVQF